MIPLLASRENHGQRLAAALGMPDDAAAPTAWVFDAQRAADNLVGRSELMVPGDLLDPLAVLDIEDDEVGDDVQHVAAIEEPRAVTSVLKRNAELATPIRPIPVASLVPE